MNDLDAAGPDRRARSGWTARTSVRDISAEDLRKRVGHDFRPAPAAAPLDPGQRHLRAAHGRRPRQGRRSTAWSRTASGPPISGTRSRTASECSGQKLSGGQQQRLCIARTLALKPDVILFDEPCSGLDPISTAKVEESMLELRKNHTIVLVTNNTKQAARVGTRTAFFLMGDMVEIGPTDRIFTAPRDKRTEDYIVGRFG